MGGTVLQVNIFFFFCPCKNEDVELHWRITGYMFSWSLIDLL